MSTPNIADLKSLFYGGGTDAEYAALKAFAAAGVNVNDLLALGTSQTEGDTKGQLLVFGDDGIYHALDPGADGTILEAHAASTLGLRYITPVATTFVRTTGDVSYTSNNTLANVTELVVALAASSVYTFEGVLMYEAGTTGDFQFAFDVPASSALVVSSVILPTTAVAAGSSVSDLVVVTDAGPFAVGGIGAGTKLPAQFKGLVVTGVTAGNLQAMAAQNTSNGTASILYTNSWLTATKVA